MNRHRSVTDGWLTRKFLKSPHATKRDENASSSVRLTCVRIAHLTSYFCFIQSPMWYEKYQACDLRSLRPPTHFSKQARRMGY